MELPGPGEYLLLASTFEAGYDGHYVMHLYPVDGEMPRVAALNKGGDVLDAKRAGMKAGGARPQARLTGPQSGAGGKKFEAPAAG